jgi:transcriptional regulator with XRE-family HTH domain
MLIQKLRLQRGWSQEQLAELSGLSASDFENGAMRLSNSFAMLRRDRDGSATALM